MIELSGAPWPRLALIVGTVAPTAYLIYIGNVDLAPLFLCLTVAWVAYTAPRDSAAKALVLAFASLVGVLRERGIRQLLVPLPAESATCALLRPFAAEVVDFNFVVKRLRDSPPVPAGPLYFDIRH